MTPSAMPYSVACLAADVPLGEGRTALVDGVRVAIFHAAEGWRCLDASCSHSGGPLADGILADASVICPLHQRRFDLQTGAPVGHDCPAVRTYPIELRGGELHVCVRAGAQLAIAA